MKTFRNFQVWCPLAVLLLSACRAQDISTSAALPTDPIVSVPATAVVPTDSFDAGPTPTIVPTDTVEAGPTPTGTYSAFASDRFRLPMSLRFGSDWRVIDNFSDLVTLENPGAGISIGFNLVNNARLADPADGHLIAFPDDFSSWIESNPDFVVDSPTLVTVAGVDGLQVDATPVWTSATSNKKTFLVLSSIAWNLVPSPPERWRFILLEDVHGERLLILMIASAPKFGRAVEQAQSVLDSVAFDK